jgi:hypothetical protein
MAVWDLFSKREKARQNAGKEDVFRYDVLPRELRIQIMHIWKDALGNFDHFSRVGHDYFWWWQVIHKAFLREKSKFHLHDPKLLPYYDIYNYFLDCSDIDALDLVEVTFRMVNLAVGDLEQYERDQLHLIHPDQAIDELNQRFREHGIGYEFTGNELIRIDSRYVHAEAVKPAIQLMHDAGDAFQGALQEFLDAHRKYREGERKDAILGAAKAFESTLKSICTERGWEFNQNKDTANRLIKIVLDNKLFPEYLQNQFTHLTGILESGIATIRNKTAGHGQGTTIQEVPEHLVSYALHLTASNIVFLIESHKALP